MLPGSSYYYKIYYLEDESKTALEGATFETITTGNPGTYVDHITGTFEENTYPEKELILEIGPKADVSFYPTTAV
jgi:hypothetical protein